MRAAKRLDKLERELVPQLERWKREILREQQVTSRKLTPQDYRRSYSPEWIRDQSGVRCLWSEAVERYWMRREPAELRKWGLSPSAIENVLNQRPVSMADREGFAASTSGSANSRGAFGRIPGSRGRNRTESFQKLVRPKATHCLMGTHDSN